jgi:rfaE bifunctional protein nucleotidyltransferase chain/domain
MSGSGLEPHADSGEARPGGETPAGTVLDLPALVERRALWRRHAERVVLTNGCFDLLHLGHVRYLAAARALGQRLVVAVNDDASVRALKGIGRPILPAPERAEVVAALRAVDAVTIFAGATAETVVRALRPDVYVKGGDYGSGALEPPEARVAAEVGADVRYLDFVPGRSTREIIARIRAGRE